jgi:hypothetical protein
MSLGAFRLKRTVLVPVILVLASVGFISCGSSSSSIHKPPSGLSTRVLASQDISSSSSVGGLIIVNAQTDILARASEISAGNTPGLMTLSPTRATLLAYDPSTVSVQVINTTTETNTGRISLPGPASSMVLPATTSIGYAAVPTAAVNGYPSGAVEVMNLTTGSTTTIGVPNAQTVISNTNGTQLLVFSPFSGPAVSNSVYVISPLIAVPPVDQGCDNLAASGACKVVSGFDQPVNAIVSGNTAYILNCGAECGGTQASVMVLDLGTLTITNTIPVNGATTGFLSGSTLFVAGSPKNTACPSSTSARSCGTLDIVDLKSMTDPNFTNHNPILITDGYHDRIDMSLGGQLFIGSHACTNVGNVNNPSGEVRGCLSIFNTNSGAVVIPPDNGDVTGLQSFSTRNVEYVAEGGTLRIYDTTKDVLQRTQISIVGQVIDMKAIDFF